MGENCPADIKILGPTNSKQPKGPDLANLRPPIHTALTGMNQALHALQAGSPEVKHILMNEASLIYECKTCLSMFRSLANLVAHKRKYCSTRYTNVQTKFREQQHDVDKENMTTVIVEPEATDSFTDVLTWNCDNYSPSMDLIQTSGIVGDLLVGPVINKLKPRTIIDVTNRLNAKCDGQDETKAPLLSKNTKRDNSVSKVILEPIFNTKNALYQSWKVSGDTSSSVKELNEALNYDKFTNKHIIVAHPTHTQSESPSSSGPSAIDSKKAPPNKDDTKNDSKVLQIPCPHPQCSSVLREFRSVKRHMVNLHNANYDDIQDKKRQNHEEKLLCTIENNCKWGCSEEKHAS